MWKLRGRGRPIRQKTLINHKQYPFKSKKTLSYVYALTSLCLRLTLCLVNSTLYLWGRSLLKPSRSALRYNTALWPSGNPSVRCNDSSSHNPRRNLFPEDLEMRSCPCFPLTPASFICNCIWLTVPGLLWRPWLQVSLGAFPLPPPCPGRVPRPGAARFTWKSLQVLLHQQSET